MAREHHCPNCGPQACNASTSRIHTCGVCAAVWEEDLSAAPAAPAPPKPAATPPAAPAATPPAAPRPATAAPQPPAKPAPSSPPVAPPAPPAPKPVAAAPSPSAPPKPAVPPAAVTTTRGEEKPDPRVKRLADVVAAAKAKRCPLCKSDSLAAPSDYAEQGGRVVLVDSQTYRGHRWYADSGEVLKAPPAPRPAPAPTTAAKTAT